MVDIKKNSNEADKIEQTALAGQPVNLDKSVLVENTETEQAVEWEEQPEEVVEPIQTQQSAEAVQSQQLNGVVNTNNSSATIEGHNCPGIGQVKHSEKFIKAEQKVDELGTKLNGAIEKHGLADAAEEVTDVLNNFGNKVTDMLNGLTSGKKM